MAERDHWYRFMVCNSVMASICPTSPTSLGSILQPLTFSNAAQKQKTNTMPLGKAVLARMTFQIARIHHVKVDN